VVLYRIVQVALCGVQLFAILLYLANKLSLSVTCLSLTASYHYVCVTTACVNSAFHLSGKSRAHLNKSVLLADATKYCRLYLTLSFCSFSL